VSTTTAAMLLLSADRLARELHASTEPVSLTQWETFDNTVHRCLHALVGPGRRLSGHDSAAGSAAVRALQEYPTPLRPAPGEVYSPREAARLTGSTAYRVTLDAAADRIHAQRVDRALQIPAEELDHRPDLTPAVSTDPHPLSRLSVAIGGMTDVLAGHRASGRATLTDDSQIAAAMRGVLSLTAVAARHTLSRVAIAEADRPLLIAQYAQRAVDALDARSGYPQLWTMTSTNPPLTAKDLNDRLEIGLRASAFAVATLRRWWTSVGQIVYPAADRLLICANGGGSNGYRVRAWKTELAALATETGLAITVCHLPPGTSKWNKIEHRLFSHISMNWRGRPLTSHEVVIDLIGATTTRTGLQVHAELDPGVYQTKIKIGDEQMSAIALDRHDFHGEWNYTVRPEPRHADE